METKVFAVRVGDKYGPHYEDYINSKIPNVTWIREELVGPKQWNKLWPMSLDIDEPIVVIDIDIIFMNDYMDCINYPVQRGEFLSAHAWWGDCRSKPYVIQGGFQKYYPKDCRYIYDEFVSKPDYWMDYYPKNKITIPGMGEQFFVEDMARQKLNIKLLPSTWITRWEYEQTYDLILGLNLDYPAEWLYLGEEFSPEIRMVHFQDLEALDAKDLKALEYSLTFS